MKKFLPLVFSSLIWTLSSFASGDNFTAGARATALSNAAVTLSDVFSTTTNQAGLGFMTNYSVGIYADRKFVNAQINNFDGAVALPISAKVGTFGISANYYGYKFYNETKIVFALVLSNV